MNDFQPGDIVTWKNPGGAFCAVAGEELIVIGPSPKRDCVKLSGASRLDPGTDIHSDNLILLDRPVVPEAAAAADVPTVITGTTTKMVWSD